MQNRWRFARTLASLDGEGLLRVNLSLHHFVLVEENKNTQKNASKAGILVGLCTSLRIKCERRHSYAS